MNLSMASFLRNQIKWVLNDSNNEIFNETINGCDRIIL